MSIMRCCSGLIVIGDGAATGAGGGGLVSTGCSFSGTLNSGGAVKSGTGRLRCGVGAFAILGDGLPGNTDVIQNKITRIPAIATVKAVSENFWLIDSGNQERILVKATFHQPWSCSNIGRSLFRMPSSEDGVDWFDGVFEAELEGVTGMACDSADSTVASDCTGSDSSVEGVFEGVASSLVNTAPKS